MKRAAQCLFCYLKLSLCWKLRSKHKIVLWPSLKPDQLLKRNDWIRTFSTFHSQVIWAFLSLGNNYWVKVRSHLYEKEEASQTEGAMPEIVLKLKIHLKYSDMGCAEDFSANGWSLSLPAALCTSILHRASATSHLETGDALNEWFTSALIFKRRMTSVLQSTLWDSHRNCQITDMM